MKFFFCLGSRCSGRELERGQMREEVCMLLNGVSWPIVCRYSYFNIFEVDYFYSLNVDNLIELVL